MFLAKSDDFYSLSAIPLQQPPPHCLVEQRLERGLGMLSQPPETHSLHHLAAQFLAVQNHASFRNPGKNAEQFFVRDFMEARVGGFAVGGGDFQNRILSRPAAPAYGYFG
jgi:hypothetical protein